MLGKHCKRREVSCSDCSGRSIQDGPADDDPDSLALSGGPLGLASMGLFVGPGVLAILGAMCFAESPGGQLVGAVAGLGLGMAGSVVLARLLRGANRSEPTDKCR